MGFHIDIKYSKNGKFRPKINSQMENTVTVIVTIGKDRIINWRQKLFNSYGSWSINPDFELSMVIKHGDITILHPNDETPHYTDILGKQIIYEHGKISLSSDCNSVAYVFRVVTTEALFNCVSNKLHISNEDYAKYCNSMLSKKGILQTKLYSTVNINKYHHLMKDAFSSTIGINNN